MLVSFAWRNLWRNKRRTLIAVSSILFALFFALIMRSMQLGTYKSMIGNMVQTYTGYVQVQEKGYWNDKDINRSFKIPDTTLVRIREMSNVKNAVPRLESFALASSGNHSKGVAVIGIDPQAEENFTHLSKWITGGRYLASNDSGVMVASGVAGYLKIKVGDTLILIGQGFHGVSAAGKFPVRGIVHFPAPELDAQLVYMTLPVCQQFYSAEGYFTSLALNLADPGLIHRTSEQVLKVFSSHNLVAVPWQQMLQDTMQQIKMDNASGLIFLAVLYLVIAFGVFGTIVMMTMERRKEFGVLVAVGMQKSLLALVTTFEMMILGLVGIVSGVIVSIPVIWYFHYHPIRFWGELAKSVESYGIEPLMSFAFQTDFFLAQCLVVFVIIVLATLYPVIIIIRLKVIKSIRFKI